MKVPSFSLLLAIALLSVPANAWDHMDAGTRTKAVALLRGAPADSDLLAEDAGSALPQAARDRALFLRAATWPDIVRATNQPALLARPPSAAIPLRRLGG